MDGPAWLANTLRCGPNKLGVMSGRELFVRLSCWVVLALPARGGRGEGKRVLVSCLALADQTSQKKGFRRLELSGKQHHYTYMATRIAARRPREPANGNVAQ